MRKKIKSVKRVVCIATALALCLSLGAFAAGPDTAPSGSGTESDPFCIGTYDQLASIPSLGMDKHYKLINDIAIPDNGTDTNWTPIGTSASRFSGVFDGGGYTISNMKVRSDATISGLFGYVVNATIKNLTIADSRLDTSPQGGRTGSNKGFIAGFGGGMTIENCHVVNGVIEGTYIGGIVGSAYGSSLIKDCSFDGSMKSYWLFTGGIAAYCEGTILRCSTSGTIEGADNTVWPTAGKQLGGIVGTLSGGSSKAVVSHCSSEMEIVSLDTYVGGIVGYATGEAGVDIHNCYSYGSITGHWYTGSIVGRVNSAAESSVRACAALNPMVKGVGGETRIGRIVGESANTPLTLNNNVALDTLELRSGNTIIENLITGGDTKHGADISEEEAMQQDTYDVLGGDFVLHWDIAEGEGRPELKDEEREVVNLLDYSDLDIGRGNNKASFTAAFTEMLATGKTLYIPMGEYDLDYADLNNSAVASHSPIYILGESRIATKLNNYYRIWARNSADVRNVSLDFCLPENYVGPNEYQARAVLYYVRLPDSATLAIDRVNAINSGGKTYTYNGQDKSFSSFLFYISSPSAGSLSSLKVSNCRIEGLSSAIIARCWIYDAVINGNTILDLGNELSVSSIGIQLGYSPESGTNAHVTDARIYGNVIDGIRTAVASGARSNGMLIYGNPVEDWEDIIVEDNTLRNIHGSTDTGHGIYTRGPRAKVRGNTLENAGDNNGIIHKTGAISGTDIVPDRGNVVISENNITVTEAPQGVYVNEVNGIYFEIPRITIKDNVINMAFGKSIHCNSARDVLIEGNEINTSGIHGVFVNYMTDNLEVIDNKISIEEDAVEQAKAIQISHTWPANPEENTTYDITININSNEIWQKSNNGYGIYIIPGAIKDTDSVSTLVEDNRYYVVENTSSADNESVSFIYYYIQTFSSQATVLNGKDVTLEVSGNHISGPPEGESGWVTSGIALARYYESAHNHFGKIYVYDNVVENLKNASDRNAYLVNAFRPCDFDRLEIDGNTIYVDGVSDISNRFFPRVNLPGDAADKSYIQTSNPDLAE